MLRNLGPNTLVTIEALMAADNEDLTGGGVDMLGWTGVLFIVGALEGEALDFKIHAEQAAVSDFTGGADLAGTEITFSTTASAKGLATLDVYKPSDRYVRAVVTVPNAAAATPTFCVAVRYGPKYAPPTSTTGEFHASPAEGTK